MFLYTCVKYEGLKLTNAVTGNVGSVSNINQNPIVVDAQIAPSAVEAFSTTTDAVDQFSTSIANTSSEIANVESQINETKDEKKKEDLRTRKEKLHNRKKELQSQKEALKAKMAQLKAEIAGHKAETEAARAEINGLTVEKADLEARIKNENKNIAAKNDMLTGVNAKIAETKTELDNTVAGLNKSVADLTKKSEDELKQQRKAISEATTEAMELVKSGEIKAEDMPAYISGKIADFTSVGNTHVASGIVDSQNSKVKMLCSQIAGYITNQGNIQVAIKASTNKLNLVSPALESLNSNIQSKNTTLKAGEAFLSSKQAELSYSNTEYETQDAEIAGIDDEIASIDSQIAASEIEVAQPEQAAKETSVQYPQFFMSRQGGAGLNINIDEEFAKIDAKSAATKDVKNSDIDGLKVKMSEADKLITTLRNHLSDTAQKIINERLEATKRR